MQTEEMPFCCTSMILGSFGDHGEKSLVTVSEINRLIKQHLWIHYTDTGETIKKRFVYASTVNPENVKILKAAGFKVIDSYPGQQGQVYVMSLHLDS